MADEAGLWQVEDDNLKEISRTKLNREERIEKWIRHFVRTTWSDGALSAKKKQERVIGFFHFCQSSVPGRTNAGISDRHISSTARCPFAGSPFCGAQRRERQPCADTSTPTVFPGLSHFVSGFT